MLVISRRIRESVQLGDSIAVQVLSIKGRRVQLGISASPEVRVLRSDLIEKSKGMPLMDTARRTGPKRNGGCHEALTGCTSSAAPADLKRL
jgi:carbon storage regulator